MDLHGLHSKTRKTNKIRRERQLGNQGRLRPYLFNVFLFYAVYLSRLRPRIFVFLRKLLVLLLIL